MVVGFDLTWMNVENTSGGIFQYALRLIFALAQFTDIDIVAFIGPTGVGLFNHFKDHKHFRVILLDDAEPFREVIQSEAVDVIHTPIQFHLNLTLSVPMITTLHDLQHIHYPEFFTRRELNFRDAYYRKSAELSERVIVSFEHVKEDITKFYNISPEKIDVCPVGMPVQIHVNQRRFDEIRGKYRLPERYLFYPANTWRHKNHIGLLRALKLLHDNYGMKIPLICTGYKYDDYYPEIQAVTEELRLERFIHFIGYIPEEDMALLLKNATLVVIPTLYEAGSFSLMEAMVNEVPVVCSRVTSLPSIIGDPKYLFDPNNVAEIAEKIAGILQDDKLLEENRENSRKRKMENSWEKVVTNFVNTYERAVESFHRKRIIPFYENWIQNYDLLTSKEINGLRKSVRECEADRAARLKVIHEQGNRLGELEAERNVLHAELQSLKQQFEFVEADRAARLEVIHRFGQKIDELTRQVNELNEQIGEQERNFFFLVLRKLHLLSSRKRERRSGPNP
jgi:glycosyltransferase involved in cell wall biosynthesis